MWSMLDRRRLMAGLCATPLLWAAGQAAAQSADPGTTVQGVVVPGRRERPKIEPYSLEDLYRPAPALDADLSADGKHVGLLVDAGQGDAREMTLLVFSADDPTVGEARFRLGDTNAHWVRWAGSERLLLGVSGASESDFTRRSRSFQRFTDQRRELPYKRVMAIGLDGKPAVQLFQPAAGPHLRIPPEKFRRVLNLSEIVEVTDPGHALMAALDKADVTTRWLSYPSRHGAGISVGLSQFYASEQLDRGPPMSTISLYRVDLATGEPALVTEGSNLTIRWEARNGQPFLRRDITQDGLSEVWRVQEGGKGPWKPLRTMPRADPDLIFLNPGDQPRTAWVLGRAPGETRRSIRRWRIDGDQLEAPVSSRPDTEPVLVLFDPNGAFLLASYRGPLGLEHDTPDAGLKALLLTLAGQFGEGASVKVLHITADHSKMLVEVSGPRQPRAYYLFDGPRRRLADIGGTQRLEPARLADAEAVSFTRSNGSAIAGVLTGWLHEAPAPIVVILQPPGDPEDLFSFDPLAQYFATRGWWTLRTAETAPEAIAALVRKAAAQAGLDPSRLAIIGEEVSGEIALAAVAGYRAAVSFSSPRPEKDLLAGMNVGARSQFTVQATAGGKPILIVRNWRDARGGRISDRQSGDAMLQNDMGTLADAIAIGEAGDADWTKLESQVARARAIGDFLEPLLR
jgi:dipeptidyl aminopeptidase/acylaminoacyl peptidase